MPLRPGAARSFSRSFVVALWQRARAPRAGDTIASEDVKEVVAVICALMVECADMIRKRWQLRSFGEHVC